jgi:diguanylate cyclase (GGDEF)-like protein
MPPSGSRKGLYGWSGVARWTFLGTLGCVLVSVAFNAVMFDDLGTRAQWRSIMSATVLPIVLGLPLFFYMSMRLRGLALSNLRLGLVARTDSLTSCLNRGAFTAKVTTLLAHTDPRPSGTLLMIDADNFKAINDLYGHDAGDEALTIIARAIRSTLRAGELVGRMGGEEFGVYLPGVDHHGAEISAERIRHSVNLAIFSPDGRPRQLSVSIGGAVFEGSASFSELFRIADQRLYNAKEAGRNRVTIVHATDYPDIALSKAS